MKESIADLFQLGKAAQGDWFSYFESHFDTATGEIVYDDPKPGAAEFCVRSVRTFFEEKNKGRKRESKMVLNPSTRAMERVTYFPDRSPEEEEKINDDAWDFAIVGVRKNGEAIDCSRADKLELIKIPMFLRFITRVFQILHGEAEKIKAASEKN